MMFGIDGHPRIRSMSTGDTPCGRVRGTGDVRCPVADPFCFPSNSLYCLMQVAHHSLQLPSASSSGRHTHVSEFNDTSESLSHRTLYDRFYCLNEIMKQIQREQGVPAIGQAVHNIYSEGRDEGRSWYSYRNMEERQPPILLYSRTSRLRCPLNSAVPQMKAAIEVGVTNRN